MFNPPLFLASFSFLFLATRDELPMYEEGRDSFHSPTTPENGTIKTARNRRRSSLLPSGFMARGTKFPAEKNLLPQEASPQNSQEDSILSDATHLDDSFENQIKSYDDAIAEPSEKFYALVEKIRPSSTPADDAFVGSVFPIKAEALSTAKCNT
ncbi:MAG: hypothetical protein NT164_05350 [Verrucomicrobiae bacterium]|nr:hypothetical protein [Verrucomicrobiae bacterium]